MKNKCKAPRNKTIELSRKEIKRLKSGLIKIRKRVLVGNVLNRVINQDIFEIIDFLPSNFVDLLFVDPPYNLTKRFNHRNFKEMTMDGYKRWMESWLKKMVRLLKPTASIYICGDWRSSAAVHMLCEKYFLIRNRITFEREKGRGS
ncbi:site-specific DNA-methyltransferase, partial [candidate division WOR-3 bacterium]|nr:site-specific DNA-methyltransferase [candidate division WOR-3 bacterium]